MTRVRRNSPSYGTFCTLHLLFMDCASFHARHTSGTMLSRFIVTICRGGGVGVVAVVRVGGGGGAGW